MRAFVRVRAILHRATELLPRALAAGVHQDCAHGPHCAGVWHADIGTNSLCLQSFMTMSERVYGGNTTGACVKQAKVSHAPLGR